MAMVLGIAICPDGRLLFDFPGALGYPYVFLFQVSALCVVALAGMALALLWLKRSGRRLSLIVLITYGLLAAWSIGLAVALFAHRDAGIGCPPPPAGRYQVSPGDVATFHLFLTCVYGTVVATGIALLAWIGIMGIVWNKRTQTA